ncbi:hypothetical protein [Demequina sp.]|uniref:hypothetical protein n=1 Tax=Demequina sp. TaxID=2050685 RepID=UPI0025EB2958|nr:hypothetical protein [Demequina sp.]
MNGSASLIIGIVAGLVLLVTVVVVIVNTARRKPAPPDEPPGRGPTGQHPDPVTGTPSETSTPHYDRRIDPSQGPQ